MVKITSALNLDYEVFEDVVMQQVLVKYLTDISCLCVASIFQDGPCHLSVIHIHLTTIHFKVYCQ